MLGDGLLIFPMVATSIYSPENKNFNVFIWACSVPKSVCSIWTLVPKLLPLGFWGCIQPWWEHVLWWLIMKVMGSVEGTVVAPMPVIHALSYSDLLGAAWSFKFFLIQCQLSPSLVCKWYAHHVIPGYRQYTIGRTKLFQLWEMKGSLTWREGPYLLLSWFLYKDTALCLSIAL